MTEPCKKFNKKFDSTISIESIYSTKEYSFIECEVIDVIYICFINYSSSTTNKYTYKLINANPIVIFNEYHNLFVNVEDVSKLNFELAKYKLTLRNDSNLLYEIVFKEFEEIEFSNTNQQHFEKRTDSIMQIKEIIDNYNYIKSYKLSYDFKNNKKLLYIELTNDEYMLDNDTIILLFEDYNFEKYTCIGMNYELKFDILSKSFVNMNYQNMFIAEFDDMITTIEISFNSCTAYYNTIVQ